MTKIKIYQKKLIEKCSKLVEEDFKKFKENSNEPNLNEFENIAVSLRNSILNFDCITNNLKFEK